MNQTNRNDPNLQWVLMYRKGIRATKIAAGAGVAESVVRYHLAIAAKQDPGLRAEHQKTLPSPAPRLTAAGKRNLDDILVFYDTGGRLRVSGSKRESALAGWLVRRRKDAADGTLSPAYALALAPALDTIPLLSHEAVRRRGPLTGAPGRAGYLSGRGHELPRHN